MTESTNNIAGRRDALEAALDDAEQQEKNLGRAIRLQFAGAWQNQPELSALAVDAFAEGPGLVTLEPSESNPAGSSPVTLTIDLDGERNEPRMHVEDGPNLTSISAEAAAERLGVDLTDLQQAVDGASNLVYADIEQHRTLDELHNTVTERIRSDLETLDREENYDPDLDPEVIEERRQDPSLNDGTLTYETAAGSGLTGSDQEASSAATSGPFDIEATPEWATNSQDESITPARVTADWVQSRTMVSTYLESGRPDLAREWIELLDDNLAGFAEGGAPPGSDELEDIYHDAVARAAIPYGEAPISPDEVREQLGNISRVVPEFDVAAIRQATGIPPLDRGYVTKQIDQGAEVPSGLQDVAAARLSVRRAMASIAEDTEAARSHLSTANGALNQAVESLRPDQTQEHVSAAQASVQQASDRVAAVAETAAKVDAEVTVYTLDNCPGCFATKLALDKAGVEYDEIPLAEHPELVNRFKKQLGKENSRITAPVVETKSGDLWAGYNPKKLREHGLDHRSRQQRTGETGRDTGHGR